MGKGELLILERLREFFGIGTVTTRTDGTVEFYINGVSNVLSIIPHFDNYSLHGLKAHNFVIWKQIVNLVNDGAHLTDGG